MTSAGQRWPIRLPHSRFVEATRYWTVPELNAQLPGGHLLANRLLWVAIALSCLVFTHSRGFVLNSTADVGMRGGSSRRKTRRRLGSRRCRNRSMWKASFLFRDGLAQFASQLKMDVAGALKNPFTYVVLLLGVVTTILDFRSHVDPLSSLPYYPANQLDARTLSFRAC